MFVAIFKIYCIFLKFDHPIYENDTSLFGKGGSRGIFHHPTPTLPRWWREDKERGKR